ncbi:MAG: hypothetical protein KDA24_27435 [Deltaproteobacteria bacterium]|nr:hypothetical protein [Deltaproteobacteria bacterium]
MRVTTRFMLSLAVLLLLAGCRPPEGATRRGADEGSSEGEAGDSRDPGSLLSVGGLGKEDYAKIRGELDCVEKHFEGEAPAKTAALASIYARYATTEDWVKGVDDLTASSPYNKRITEAVKKRVDQVCPGGKLSAEFTAMLSAAPPKTGEAVPKAAGAAPKADGAAPKADEPTPATP